MANYIFEYTITGCWSVDADDPDEAMELAEAHMDDRNDNFAGDEWRIDNLHEDEEDEENDEDDAGEEGDE